MSETREFPTGMQRSGDADHLDFTAIHPVFQIALARVLADGAIKYGSHNYELGSDVVDNLNHVLRHVCLYLAGDRSENHLANASCGMMFAVVNDVLHPELSRHRLRGPGCTLTPAMLAHLEAGKADRHRRREAGEFDELGRWRLAEVPEVAEVLRQREQASRLDNQDASDVS